MPSVHTPQYDGMTDDGFKVFRPNATIRGSYLALADNILYFPSSDKKSLLLGVD